MRGRKFCLMFVLTDFDMNPWLLIRRQLPKLRDQIKEIKELDIIFLQAIIHFIFQ